MSGDSYQRAIRWIALNGSIGTHRVLVAFAADVFAKDQGEVKRDVERASKRPSDASLDRMVQILRDRPAFIRRVQGLYAEAKAAGDSAMVALCRRALTEQKEEDEEQCALALADAEAMEDGA